MNVCTCVCVFTLLFHMCSPGSNLRRPAAAGVCVCGGGSTLVGGNCGHILTLELLAGIHLYTSVLTVLLTCEGDILMYSCNLRVR